MPLVAQRVCSTSMPAPSSMPVRWARGATLKIAINVMTYAQFAAAARGP